MSSNYEGLNNLSSAIQSWVVTIGLVIGGFWSLYSLDVYYDVEKAKSELKEINLRIANSESSSISIKTETFKTPKVSGLIINVIIKNIGKDKLVYDISGTPIQISKIKVKGDNIKSTEVLTPKYYSKLSTNAKEEANKYLEEQVVLVGAEKTLTYMVELEKSGLYYITFKSPPVNMKISSAQNNNDEKNYQWFAAKYVNVDLTIDTKKTKQLIEKEK
jgi:hypothetical protein